MVVEFDMVRTIGFAVVLLLFGRLIRSKIKFFQTFAIPAPVIGGFSFAIVNLFLRQSGLEINFDTTLQSFFMVIFFTSIGFGASIKILRAAGPKVFLFLLIAGFLCVIQNTVALGLSGVVGIDKGLALMTGSTPMTGGHGTSGGIAPLVEASGVKGAETVAYSAATFGLVMGSLMGGPLANKLVTGKNLLLNRKEIDEDDDLDESLLKTEARVLDGDRILKAFFVILIAMFLGSYISNFLNVLIQRISPIAKFPSYIGPMLLAIIARYISDKGADIVPVEEVEVVGNVGLNLFLGMALMTLKLWELIDLAIPLIVLLLAQTLLMAIYAYFVTFRLMGSNYDAAVLAGGHCGFGMGATPNGVANMESICEKFVYSKTAFFVLPIVGGMFIDFVNVFIISMFLAFI